MGAHLRTCQPSEGPQLEILTTLAWLKMFVSVTFRIMRRMSSN